MGGRWAGFLLTATVAAVVGIGVASVMGGGASSAWLVVLPVALLVAIVLFKRRRVAHMHHRAPWWTGDPEPAATGVVEPEDRVDAEPQAAIGSPEFPWPLTEDDWRALHAVLQVLGPLQLTWLRSTTFATPWLDSSARAALGLCERLAPLRARPFPPEIQDGLADVFWTATAFADSYERETLLDPLVLEGAWRTVGADEDTATGGGAQALRAQALELAAAFERLASVASQWPQVRAGVGKPA